MGFTEFLAEAKKLFGDLGIRMKALFGRINETRLQIEKMRRCAAKTMEAEPLETRRGSAKARLLSRDFLRRGGIGQVRLDWFAEDWPTAEVEHVR